MYRIQWIASLALSLFVVSSALAQMRVGNNFWFRASWSGETPFQSGVNFSTTTDPWNPTFINELLPYNGPLRFMDWNGTNNSTEDTWSDRMPKSGSQDGRVAYEWQIDLCNRTDSDLWVCIPHMADSTYWNNLAMLIRDQLEPGRLCYVEYSNETWNNQFSQAQYTIDYAKNSGFVPLADRGQTWENEVAKAYGHVGKIVRIGQTFQNVFGSSFNTRVRVVMSGQAGNTWLTGQIKNAVNDSTTNPNNFRPHCFALAPYIGGSFDGAASNIETLWSNEVSSTSTTLTEHRNTMSGQGYEFITYEGGQHITTNSDVFARNSRSYNMYRQYMDMLKNHFTVFTHYTHCGTWSSGGAWGAKAFTGQSTADAHKYRALIDWIAANSGGGGSQGTFGNNGNPWSISSSGTTRLQAENYDTGGEDVAYNDTTSGNSGGAYRSDNVDLEATSDSGGGYNVGWVSSGEWLEYTVNVAASGTYDIRFRVARQPTGSGSLSLAFNGTDKTGTMSVPSTGGWQTFTTITKTGVSLSAGQQVMRLNLLSDSINVNWIEIAAAGGSSTPSIPAGTVTIDTTIDSAWSSATAQSINNISGSIGSTSDCSGTWRGLWDTNNLYVLAQVTDDNKSNDSTDPWADDSVEIYLDGNNNKTTSYDSNDRQYIFGWGDTTVREGGGRSTTGVTFAKADPSSTSYRIELKVPWSTLGVTASSSKLIGIDCHINDDDSGGAREGKRMWNDTTDTAWGNPSKFGTAQLTGTPSGGSTTVTLNPTDDRDTQSDNTSGTNTTYNASNWNHIFQKYSLSSISGTVTNATLRIYRNSNSLGTVTVNAYQGASDNWTEGGSTPGLGTLITSVSHGSVAYVEFNVTSFVNAQASGDDVATFGITVTHDNWTSFNSDENSSNRPQLVVTYSN